MVVRLCFVLVRLVNIFWPRLYHDSSAKTSVRWLLYFIFGHICSLRFFSSYDHFLFPEFVFYQICFLIHFLPFLANEVIKWRLRRFLAVMKSLARNIWNFFCSTTLPLASIRSIDIIKPLSTVLNSTVNLSPQHQGKNSCECWESKPGLPGE